jgi:hypothetical protein
MKNFFQFLKEAQSQASMQAKKLNLVSDGHGGWLDSRGKFVATTEDGKLQFVDKKKPKGQEEPTGKPRAAAQPEPTQKVAQPEEPARVSGQTDTGEVGSGSVEDTATVVFGRFNPPTVGHGKLLSAAKKAAAGGDLAIYPSRTQDSKKNPLDPDMKISFMKKMFPEYKDDIINDAEMISIFNVLGAAAEGGYKNVNIIVGSDRQSEFDNLAQKYNGELYNFEMINVISAGVRDADSSGVEGMSASKMRKAVVDDDFAAFRRGTPKELNDGDTQALFDAVRRGMKIKMKKEVAEMWEIAPKFDAKGLREQYVNGFIYKIGDIVESLHTGLIGEIVRRGTNHLICVTRENYMFKSWIRDVMEYDEKTMNSRMRDSKHPNTLVGTAGYLKNAMAATGTTGIKNFINKNKKKK